MPVFTRRRPRTSPSTAASASHAAPPVETGERCTPIGAVRWRERVRVSGRVRSVKVQPWGGVATLECTLVDDTGGISVVFVGRREIAGIHPGTTLIVEGMAGSHAGRLALLNPDYELTAPPEH